MNDKPQRPQAGKGDAPRPVDGRKYREGYERAFGKRPGHWEQVAWERMRTQTRKPL